MQREHPARGDIYYITGDPNREIGSETWSDRPGVIVSNDVLNRTSGVVSIVYLSASRNRRPSPTHAAVVSGGKPAVAMCEQIQTVDKSRLAEYIGTATKPEMDDVDGAILFALQINKGKRPDGIFRKYLRQLELERQAGMAPAGKEA